MQILNNMETKTNNRDNNIVLDRVERYDATQLDCYPFRRGTDTIDNKSLAIGNMVSGFPFVIEGVEFQNSEAAYIAGMFSDGSEKHNTLQEELRVNTNGFLAKKTIRRFNEGIMRTDWKEYNIQWMLYTVWCKVATNPTFRRILMAIPSTATIIEDSTFQAGPTAMVWGTKNDIMRKTSNKRKTELENTMCKAAVNRQLDEERLSIWRKQGEFVGKNLMGKILMLCQNAVLNNTTPPIDVELLRNKKINFFGNILTFDNIPVIQNRDVA